MSELSPPAGWGVPASATWSGPDLPAAAGAARRLAALDPVGRATAMCLRRFRMAGAAAVEADFAAIWPGGTGRAPALHLVGLFRLIFEHGARPQACHALAAPLIDAGEADLADLVCTAATGEAEDALRIALRLVRADLAPAAVAGAQQAGLALHRAMIRSTHRPQGGSGTALQ